MGSQCKIISLDPVDSSELCTVHFFWNYLFINVQLISCNFSCFRQNQGINDFPEIGFGSSANHKVNNMSRTRFIGISDTDSVVLVFKIGKQFIYFVGFSFVYGYGRLTVLEILRILFKIVFGEMPRILAVLLIPQPSLVNNTICSSLIL